MEPTEQAGWENRLEELIEGHIRSLKNDFRSFLDEMTAPEPPDPEPPADLQATLVRLKESVDAVLGSGSQREMAAHLLDAVSLQANRAALLLVREKGLHAFDARGFTEPAGQIATFRTEPAGDDPLARALLVTQHLPGEALEGTCLAAWHDGQWPAHVCLAPIYVGTRTVAVLYADSGDTDAPGRIHPEAVEILASMAGLFLDRLRHAARPSVVDEPASTVTTFTENAGAPAALHHATTAADDHHADAFTDDGQDPGRAADDADGVHEFADQGSASFDHANLDSAGQDGASFDSESAPAFTPRAGASIDDGDGGLATASPVSFEETTQPAWEPVTNSGTEADGTMPGVSSGVNIGVNIEATATETVDNDVALDVAPAHQPGPEEEEFDPAAIVDEPAPQFDETPTTTDEFDAATTVSAPTPHHDEAPAPIPVTTTFDAPAPPTQARADGAMVSTASGGSLRATTPDENPVVAAIPLAPEPTTTATTPATALSPPAAPAPSVPSDNDVTVASELPVNPDAERFARLLVSEIVLYNEAAVARGKKSRDLYRRLRDPIDRSREVFVDRFNKDLLVLFEAEMVRTLADNDRALMGSTYS